MLKFKFAFDKGRIVGWLNNMSEKGWAVTRHAGPFFSFSPCKPDEYRYEVDVTDKPFRATPAYRELMNDFDIDIVDVWGPWVLLRKKAADGPFELYTDVPSRIAQRSRILRFFKLMCILECICCAILFVCFASEPQWLYGILAVFAAFVAAAMARYAVELKRQIVFMQTGALPEQTPFWAGLFICAVGLILSSQGMLAESSALGFFLEGAGIGFIVCGLVWAVSHLRHR